MGKIKNNQSGITMITLVITIILVLILSSISINLVLGEKGLFRQNKELKEARVNKAVDEEASINELLREYVNSVINRPVEEDEEEDDDEVIEEVLPSEYTRLAYIEGTGTQYLDINYTYADDNTPYRIKCKFRYTDVSTSTAVFGANKHSSGVQYPISLMVDSNQKFTFSRLGISGKGIRFADADTEVHEFEYVFGEGVYFDGVLMTDTVEPSSLTGVASGTKIGVFARFNGSVNNVTLISSCQIMSMEFYGLNDEPHRILIPCQRKADGEIGMYDTVTETFYTNIGTGEFTGA